MTRNCDWVEKCEKPAEYFIIITPDFTCLFFCHRHLLDYMEGLLLSNMSNAWHFDISRVDYR